MFTERRIPVSPGVELFTAVSAGPRARALLVIHGGPDWDHTYLRRPLDRLAGQVRLVMPDLRGCGRSTVGLPDGAYTPDAVVADLVALLDALEFLEVDVLGFSYGGLVAQRLVATTRERAPGRVRRLMVASSSVPPVPPDAFADWPEREARRAAEAAVWARGDADGPALTRAAALAGAPANVWTDAGLRDYVRRLDGVHFTGEWLRPWRAGTLPSPRLADPVAELAAADVPVLLLHGEHDMVFPVALAREAGGALPRSRVVVLPEAGHMAHIDQPDAWLQAVAAFVAERLS